MSTWKRLIAALDRIADNQRQEAEIQERWRRRREYADLNRLALTPIGHLHGAEMRALIAGRGGRYTVVRRGSPASPVLAIDDPGGWTP